MLEHGPDGGWFVHPSVLVNAPAGTVGHLVSVLMPDAYHGIAAWDEHIETGETSWSEDRCRSVVEPIILVLLPEETTPGDLVCQDYTLIFTWDSEDPAGLDAVQRYTMRLVLDPDDRMDPDDPCTYAWE